MHGAHVLRTVFHGRAGVRRGGAGVLAGADLSRETISFSGERPMALEVQALTGRRFAAPIDFAAHIQRAARDLVRVAVGLGRNPIPEDLWPILATDASERCRPAPRTRWRPRGP